MEAKYIPVLSTGGVKLNSETYCELRGRGLFSLARYGRKHTPRLSHVGLNSRRAYHRTYEDVVPHGPPRPRASGRMRMRPFDNLRRALRAQRGHGGPKEVHSGPRGALLVARSVVRHLWGAHEYVCEIQLLS